MSTEEQSRDNQREDIDRVVQTRGYTLVSVYEETRAPHALEPNFPA